ncbi:MAG: alpha-L-fucosidase [Bacilli bacterium]|nr:alpha-L-fucosidase [Bacilli bacterium]
MDNKTYFKKAQYGMMIHFGLYSILAGEYRGKRMGSTIGEWIQAYFQIPIKEYEQLAKVFNPIYFNADEWVDLAKKAGMKYMVVTTKHHEGFALFHSKVDKFNVVDATPFKRDIIKELSDACHKKGLKFGIYYSQALDWHEKNGAGYDKVENIRWCNCWDFKDKKSKNYHEMFERKIKPQVKELLTKYGELFTIWFDTPRTISEKESIELYQLVKKYQPNALVNSRIGSYPGMKYDYISLGDNEIPKEYKNKDLLFESPCTLNDTWGYKSYDQNWKSPEKILEIKKHLNERNINYLLNVGPDYLGRIPKPSVDVLLAVKKLMDKEKRK